MLGVLLESRAPRQRRAGGAAMSVAAHLAVVGALTAAAAHATRVTLDHPSPVLLRFPPPPRPPIAARMDAASGAPDVVAPVPEISLMHLLPLARIPNAIPPVIQVAGHAYDSVVIRAGPHGASNGLPKSILGDGDAEANDRWGGSEALMHVVRAAKPRYPDMLRSAGIDGRVLVQFTVDTTGRVDMASVKILASTHELFTRAVRDALRDFRFAPAEVGGRRVPALAQMPFEFQLSR